MDPQGLQPSHTYRICLQAKENQNIRLILPYLVWFLQTYLNKCSYKEQNQKDGE